MVLLGQKLSIGRNPRSVPYKSLVHWIYEKERFGDVS